MENYFDMLGQNVPNEEKKEESQEMVNLTVRADAECTVHCDGDFLFILEPGKIQKELVPVGQHILEFISTEDQDVKVEKVVDYPTAGKNYVLIINEFSAIFASKKAKAAEEKAAKEAEEEAKLKVAAEEEKIHTIRITDEYGNGGTYTGRLKDGKPHGNGRAEYEDGTVYEGEWKDGLRNGRCIFYFQDGTRYEGGCHEDIERIMGTESHVFHFSGKCSWHFSDGSKLEGENKTKDDWHYVSGVFTDAYGETYKGDYITETDFDGNFYANETHV